MNQKNKIWVIIPAAGVGRRMQSDIPKQYLSLNGKSVFEYSLNVFDKHESVSEIVVVVSDEDEYWPSLSLKLSKPLHKVIGGKERCDSVLNGLQFLKDKADESDWILVHDAARPCLRKDDISLLLNKLSEHEVGGILAIPVRDTMKRSAADSNTIKETVERENLWHALTPQMFRYKILKDSIESALKEEKIITDEASAVELSGYQPVLIEGHADNLKITRPEDLALAAYYLKQQGVK